MITAEDEEGEKARALRRKLIKNIVEAKLKNERENERLGRQLGQLAKEKEREMRNIQRNLVSLRSELQAMETAKTSDKRLKVSSAVHTHVSDRGDFLVGYSKREDRLYQRRQSDFSCRSPMSFLELRRLPRLQSTEEGLVVWPLPPVRHSISYDRELRGSLIKQRGRTFALPKIELPDHDKVKGRKRLQSSPAVLKSLSTSQLATINSEGSRPKQQQDSTNHEAEDE